MVDGFWYRADINASVEEAAGDPCEDGDPVWRWLDQLNANHATQAVLGNRPTYQDDPFLEFDGNDALGEGALGNGPSTNNFLAVMVVRINAWGQDHTLLDKWTAGNIGFWSCLHDTNDTFYVAITDTTPAAATIHSPTTGLLSATWYCLGFYQDWVSDTLSVYISSTIADGSVGTGALNGDLGNASNAIIANATMGVAQLNGDMREICYMHGALEEADIQDIITRFMFRWSIP